MSPHYSRHSIRQPNQQLFDRTNKLTSPKNSRISSQGHCNIYRTAPANFHRLICVYLFNYIGDFPRHRIYRWHRVSSSLRGCPRCTTWTHTHTQNHCPVCDKFRCEQCANLPPKTPVSIALHSWHALQGVRTQVIEIISRNLPRRITCHGALWSIFICGCGISAQTIRPLFHSTSK